MKDRIRCIRLQDGETIVCIAPSDQTWEEIASAPQAESLEELLRSLGYQEIENGVWEKG